MVEVRIEVEICCSKRIKWIIFGVVIVVFVFIVIIFIVVFFNKLEIIEVWIIYIIYVINGMVLYIILLLGWRNVI